MNAGEKKELLPYELTGGKYALWRDVGGMLGTNVQIAVEQYLCRGKRMMPPNGELDERSKVIIRRLAAKRAVLIPEWAFDAK
jgi:hypothetical protein